MAARLWDEFKQQKKDFDVYMDEERKVRDAQRKIRDEEYQKKLYVLVERPWVQEERSIHSKEESASLHPHHPYHALALAPGSPSPFLFVLSEEEELKKVPFEEEMALCDYLVSYLKSTFLSTSPSTSPHTTHHATATRRKPAVDLLSSPHLTGLY